MNARHLARALAVAGLFIVVGAGTAHAQDGDLIQRGKAQFQHTCAPCHGMGPGDDGRPMLPGSQSLQFKYKGSLSAFLERRSDLPYEVLRVYVRRGSWSMPGFRKTEVTDADVRAIAAYLADSAKQGAAH